MHAFICVVLYRLSWCHGVMGLLLKINKYIKIKGTKYAHCMRAHPGLVLITVHTSHCVVMGNNKYNISVCTPILTENQLGHRAYNSVSRPALLKSILHCSHRLLCKRNHSKGMYMHSFS